MQPNEGAVAEVSKPSEANISYCKNLLLMGVAKLVVRRQHKGCKAKQNRVVCSTSSEDKQGILALL